VDVLVLMPRFEGRGKDSIPHYGLRRWLGRVLRGICGGYVKKNLFSVPIEKGRDICIKIESYMRVLFSFCAIIVRSSFCYLDIS